MQNEGIGELWKSTSNHTNIQYGVYKNTKDVLKAIQSEHEDRLKNHLVSKGSFFSNIVETSLSSMNPIWSLAQRNLPKNIFNFSVRYINSSSPNRTNLTKWGISPTSDCSFCLQPESLLHVAAGCAKCLDEGRYTWPHDSILHFLASSFQSIKNSSLYVDIPGCISPCASKSDSLRLDLLLITRDKCFYLLELTVGFESNLRNNSNRKQLKYKTWIGEQQKYLNDVRFVNLSMSALGIFDHLIKSILDMLQDLKFDVRKRSYKIRRKMTIAIRSTFYIFCRRNKDWESPKLLVF